MSRIWCVTHTSTSQTAGFSESSDGFYSPSLGIDHNGVGFVDHAGDKGLAVPSIDLGHLNHVPARVSPIEVAGDPVHCDATWHL